MTRFTTIAKTNGITIATLGSTVAGFNKEALGIVGKTDTLFTDVAWFIYLVFNSPELLKQFIVYTTELNATRKEADKIKIPVAYRDMTGEALSEKEQKAVAKAKTKAAERPAFYLFACRVIYDSNDGTLRSFENHAYPIRNLCETASDKGITVKDKFIEIWKTAKATSKDGKRTLKGIEALRRLDQLKYPSAGRESGSSNDVTSAKPTIPAEAVAFTGIGSIAKAVAAKVTFDADGWAIIAIHKDGDTTRGMFNVEVEDDQRNAMIAAAYEKAKASGAKAPLTKTITDKSQIGFNERAPA